MGIDAPAPQSQIFSVITDDGVRLEGEVWEKEGTATVVLLHGIGQSRHSWRRAAKALAAADLQVVTYDLRGHGNSDWSKNADYSRARAGADLRTVVEALALDAVAPPVLGGFSYGGDVALTYAACGHRVAGIALVDVAPHVDEDGNDEIQDFLARSTAGFATLDEVAASVAELNGDATPAPGAAMERHVRRDGGTLFWKWDPNVFDLDIDLELRERELNEAVTATSRTPLILVRGGMSTMLSDESVRRLLAVRPDTEYVNVEGAGHSASGGTNDAFLSVVTGFCREVTVPDRETTPATTQGPIR
ncbi:alpha/beta fold hydrolase [Gordonia terrae]|nr:alpha/beta hydrolase [Gordonia terrae]ANY21834.1 hypothetical protein BCM27_02540 [Gordonia terrae]GAB44772.1 hypothetical protein GOTRE_071_00990 [Gordonia terrae NBRC 100016]VTR09150.1 non-heme haloperoxidase family protein [Clostridioides difficile]VTS21939.1 Non-haem bromoperoxidase BPO-A2 [Gordonia terrae]